MFCPKCGKDEFQLLDGKHCMCASCEFCYFHNVAAAVSVIILWGKKILVTQRAKNPGAGKLDLPGGFVDPGEGLEQALVREIKEELGFNLANANYLCSFANPYEYANVQYMTLDAVFVTELTEWPVITAEAEEIAGYCWQTLDEIVLQDFAFNSSRQALALFQKAQNAASSQEESS